MKVRVICSDPYATDSSSDEETEGKTSHNPSSRKQFVREIIVPSFPKSDVPSPIDHDHDQAVRLTKSGKWGAFIWDPVKRTQINWVGLYDTREEAVTAYDAKKRDLDFTNLIGESKVREFSSKENDCEDPNEGNSLKSESLIKEKHSKSTSMHDVVLPVSQNDVGGANDDSVGSIRETPSESETSMNGKLSSSSRHDAVRPLSQPHHVGFTKPRGVVLTKSGKWGVHIWDPFKKTEVWVGTYDTPEEAANARERKKMEFESLGARYSRKSAYVSHLGSEESRKDISKDNSSFLSREVSERVLMMEGSLLHQAQKKLKTGEYGGFIKHPLLGRISLGSYGTPSEAARAFAIKMEEVRGLVTAMVAANKSQSWVMETTIPASEEKSSEDEAETNLYHVAVQESDDVLAFNNNRHEDQLPVKNHVAVQNSDDFHLSNKNNQLPVVKQTKSGKWGTSLWDPIRKRTQWLGSYFTPEEATNVYYQKRLELIREMESARKYQKQDYMSNNGEKAVRERGKRVIRKRTREDYVVLSDLDDSDEGGLEEVEYPGVKLRKCGLWSAEIRNPTRVWLGLYRTPREAILACKRKKRELKKSSFCEPQHGVQEIEVTATDLNSNDYGEKRRYPGVRQKKPGGRWIAEIQARKSEGWYKQYLGTYDTQEEAADAFNNKKLELKLVGASGKKDKKLDLQSVAASEQKAKKMELEAIAGSKNKAKQVNASPLDQSGFTASASASLPNSASEIERSTITLGNSHESDGSNSSVENLTLPVGEEFGYGIINNYGQLLGEYSKLDEELWFSKPDEDDDQEIVGADDQRFAWEFKPQIKPGSVI